MMARADYLDYMFYLSPCEFSRSCFYCKIQDSCWLGCDMIHLFTDEEESTVIYSEGECA